MFYRSTLAALLVLFSASLVPACGDGRDAGTTPGDVTDAAADGDAVADVDDDISDTVTPDGEAPDTDDASDADPDGTDPGGTDPDGDDSGTGDGGQDGTDASEDTRDPLVDEWPVVPRTEADGDADPTTWTPGTELPEGQARVGVVTAEQGSPFSGPEMRCREGDLVLANAHLTACITGLLSPSQYTYAGGYIVDLAPTGALDGEMLEAFVPGVDLRTAAAQEIAVLRDGRDGGDAVVSVSGTDAPVTLLGNYVAELFSGVPLDFETEYRLSPDATALEVVTWVRSADPEFVRARIAPGDLLIGGDLVTAWAPRLGPLADILQADVDYWAGVSADFTYGVWSEQMTAVALAPGFHDVDLDPVELTEGVIGPATEAVYVRYVAVARDTFALEAAFAPHADAPEGDEVRFAGPVDEAHAERRYVIADAAGDEVGVVRLDNEGEGRARLPAGAYTATWWGRDDADSVTEFTVPAGDDVALDTPDVGLLRLWIEAIDGGDPVPSPARVDIFGPVGRLEFVERGTRAVALPPGTYTLVVSRGEEFSLATVEDVVVPAGDEVTAMATVRRQMDTTGWVSGDFHQHQRRSIDSVVPNTDRVASNLGAGVDFMAPSDHDAVEDFGRIVDEMDVDDLLHAVRGSEISPAWGHMNAFPLPYDSALQRFGAVPLSRLEDRTPTRLSVPELIDTARELGARVVQINHPRHSDALFDSAGYDPVLGPEFADEMTWPDDFESIEIVNDPAATCETMRDWFSLLSRGWRVAGVGNSDTHSLDNPAGWPRNYLVSPTDDPAELTDDIIMDAVLELAVSVSGGIFLDFPEGPTPGATVPLPDEGPLALRIRAQTPEWADADVLIAYVNGIELWRQPIDGGGAEALVDLDETVEIAGIDEDAYVVFFAYAEERHAVATPGRPVFGFTNPIFVDADGDEEWTPPGVDGPEDLPMPTGLPFCP